jgi:AraC family transcriptional regulator
MLRDSDASFCKPSACGLPQSVMPPAFEPGTRLHAESHDDRNEARQLHHRTAPETAHPVVQISPSEAVTRRSVSWPSMAGEIVQANRRGRINFRFCAPVHMLAMYERSVRQQGGTFIEGLPQSMQLDCSRKLVFVPAGHEFHDWQEPRTLPRVAFFYFNPARLGSSPELGFSSMLLAPRLFFEESALWDTALKLKTLIESDGSDNRLYVEALSIVLAHELVRLDIALRDGEPQVHAHVVAGRSDGTAHGGHLLEARVRPTCELILTESPIHLQKKLDSKSGIALIQM